MENNQAITEKETIKIPFSNIKISKKIIDFCLGFISSLVISFVVMIVSFVLLAIIVFILLYIAKIIETIFISFKIVPLIAYLIIGSVINILVIRKIYRTKGKIFVIGVGVAASLVIFYLAVVAFRVILG